MNTETTNGHTPATAQLEAIASGITSVPDAFIQALKLNQAITAADYAIGSSVNQQSPAFVALPKDFGTHDLEHLLPHRRRARGKMETAYIKPFAEYAQAHSEPGAAVFVNAASMTAEAVLDLGTKESPGHADHRAVLDLQATAAYTALLNINGRAQSQQALAEFFEDWGAVATLKFFSADSEVTPGKAIAAVRRITIENLRKTDSEEQQLSANRTAFESVKASSQEPIPTTIYFETKPYPELQARTFVLRLSILTGGSAPQLVLRIVNLETHVEEMGQELTARVQDAISGAMPVLMGSYTKTQ